MEGRYRRDSCTDRKLDLMTEKGKGIQREHENSNLSTIITCCGHGVRVSRNNGKFLKHKLHAAGGGCRGEVCAVPALVASQKTRSCVRASERRALRVMEDAGGRWCALMPDGDLEGRDLHAPRSFRCTKEDQPRAKSFQGQISNGLLESCWTEFA